MKHFSSLSDEELGVLIGRQHRVLPDVPLALQRSVINLWRSGSLVGATKTLSQLARAVITAVLSFDSWAESAMAQGVRSADSPTRHLLYSAAGRDVDLRILFKADAYSISGQVLGPDEAGIVELSTQALAVEGTQRDHGARVTELNTLGEFRIEGVPQGCYRLTLRLGGDDIELPLLDVGNPNN